MNRRGFLKRLGIGLAIAATVPQAIVSNKKFEEELKTRYNSEWERLYREKMDAHKKDIERALLFGVRVEQVNTPFGMMNYIRG